MSNWNYRAITKNDPTLVPDPTVPAEVYYGIYEVYYNSNGDITAISENEVAPYAESLEGLELSLSRMAKACNKPILVFEDIEFASMDA